MERNLFISGLTMRLGRAPLTEAPTRGIIGVSESYIEAPFGERSAGRQEWPTILAEELTGIGGKVQIADDIAGAIVQVRESIAGVVGSDIVSWSRTEFSGWDVDFLWDEIGVIEYTSLAKKLNDAELLKTVRAAKVGITGVNYGVVNSGTIVLYTGASRNRSVSLLPTLHLALIKESQLVDRLGGAMPVTSENADAIPSSIHFITGPSRSADIENDLSIGVHGPAALTVIICKGI